MKWKPFSTREQRMQGHIDTVRHKLSKGRPRTHFLIETLLPNTPHNILCRLPVTTYSFFSAVCPLCCLCHSRNVFSRYTPVGHRVVQAVGRGACSVKPRPPSKEATLAQIHMRIRELEGENGRDTFVADTHKTTHICHKHHCHEIAKFKCNRCKEARYCSATCQRKHWKKAHKHACKAEAKGPSGKAIKASKREVLAQDGVRQALPDQICVGVTFEPVERLIEKTAKTATRDEHGRLDAASMRKLEQEMSKIEIDHTDLQFKITAPKGTPQAEIEKTQKELEKSLKLAAEADRLQGELMSYGRTAVLDKADPAFDKEAYDLYMEAQLSGETMLEVGQGSDASASEKETKSKKGGFEADKLNAAGIDGDMETYNAELKKILKALKRNTGRNSGRRRPQEKSRRQHAHKKAGRGLHNQMCNA